MEGWERLEREATAGPPWQDSVGHGPDTRLCTFLRNRSPQLRALVKAAREAVDGRCKCKPESGCLDAQVRAALKALDEVK